MTAEQLQAARAAHWRQQQNPLLTLEDAEGWLAQHPLCLFLPRAAQLPAPAPSFVEATLGHRETTPGADAIRTAQELLTRLVAAGTAVGLNLLGTVTEQADFVAHRDALPYVVCLRADADWKQAPKKSSGHKVSPLVLELWKALESAGARTASDAREALGRELTEAAVLRALCELWQGLRILPVGSSEGQPVSWEMLRVNHRAALTQAAATSQVTALSLLVSMYLQSVYAASSEEMEVFLSPVSSRSRVREAVRGLAATRQIHSLSMDAQTYYFLENGLPEFALAGPAVEVALAPPAARSEPIFRRSPVDRRTARTTGAGRLGKEETPLKPKYGLNGAPSAGKTGARPVRASNQETTPFKPKYGASRPPSADQPGARPGVRSPREKARVRPGPPPVAHLPRGNHGRARRGRPPRKKALDRPGPPPIGRSPQGNHGLDQRVRPPRERVRAR